MNTHTAPTALHELPLLDLLELVARHGQALSLSEASRLTGASKPWLHRSLTQLESEGWLQGSTSEHRTACGERRYAPSARLLHLARLLQAGEQRQRQRHAVLLSLVQELGESCQLTALCGRQVVALDRIDTDMHGREPPAAAWAQPVPAHCSASGKLLLAHLAPAARHALIHGLPLTAHTPHTLVGAEELEAECSRIRRDGFAVDAEEFLPGLVCVAVPVPPAAGGPLAWAVSLQLPTARVGLAQALHHLPRLRSAAAALAALHD